MSVVQRGRKGIKDLWAWLANPGSEEPTDLPVLKDPPASKDLPARKGSLGKKARKAR